MPRAHRWAPDAIVAVTKTSSAEKQEQELHPVVVFCPHAAKGSQNAAAAAERNNKNDSTTAATTEHQNTTNSTNNETKKRNPQDIVTATAFWLVDANINRVIGRLEKEGLVNILEHYLNNDERGKKLIQPNHIKSHIEYTQMMHDNLQTEGQRNFYMSEFVTNPVEEKRKFGNMAVGGKTDVKCAHALSAQYMANVACPLGELVVKFIVHIAKTKTIVMTENEEEGKDDKDKKQKEDDKKENDEKESQEEENEKDWRDNLISLFKQFVDGLLDKGEEITGKFIPVTTASTTKLTINNDVTEIVESAKKILKAFLEKGEGSGRRRKRRTD